MNWNPLPRPHRIPARQAQGRPRQSIRYALMELLGRPTCGGQAPACQSYDFAYVNRPEDALPTRLSARGDLQLAGTPCIMCMCSCAC